MNTELVMELEQVKSSPVIRAPRKPWLEFVLHFFTFGVYTCFWMVARVREFNQINDNKFTPWLWFFVPLVALAQLFALPKFNKARDAIETKLQLRSWNDHQGSWFFCVVCLSFSMKLADRFPLPDWVFFILFIFWALMFAWVQNPINRIKNKLGDVQFRGKRKGYSVWEWIGLLLGGTLMIFLLYDTIVEPLTVKTLQTLERDTLYQEEDHQFSFPIEGKGWSKVEIGSYSDGTALLELRGPLSDMSILVFKHGRDDTLNSVMRWRVDNVKEEIEADDCKETRVFAKSRLSVNTYTVCSGSMTFLPVTYTISLIETEQGIYEMLGYLSDEKKWHEKHIDSLKKMARGFEPL